MDNKKPQHPQKGPAAPQHKGQPTSTNRPNQPQSPQGKQQQPAGQKKSGCCW